MLVKVSYNYRDFGGAPPLGADPVKKSADGVIQEVHKNGETVALTDGGTIARKDIHTVHGPSASTPTAAASIGRSSGGGGSRSGGGGGRGMKAKAAKRAKLIEKAKHTKFDVTGHGGGTMTGNYQESVIESFAAGLVSGDRHDLPIHHSEV